MPKPMRKSLEFKTDAIMERFPLQLIQAAFSLRSRTKVEEVSESVQQFVVQAVDARLDELIRDIGACHNELQTINRLPNELLAVIFEIATRDGLNWDKLPLQRQTPFNITQVSSRWYRVGVSIPRLWATIDPATRPLVSLFLSRSQSAPLDIYITEAPVMADDVAAFLSPLLPHIARWRILHISCKDLGSLPQLLSAPAPLLEELNVTLKPGRLVLPIMLRLFADCTPRLRALRLDGLPLHLTASTYTGLSSLHFNYFSHRDSMGTIGQLHRALAACPLLEDLFCDYSSLSTSSVPDMPRDHIHAIRIDLPHLRNAKLVFWANDNLHHFLAPIYFPPSLRLKLRVMDDAGFDLRDAYPTTQDMVSHLPSIFLARQMQISSQYLYRSESYLHSVHAGDFGRDTGQVEKPHLLSVRYRNVSQDTRFYRHIMEPFPLQLLESLIIEGFHGPPQDFVDLLTKASSLTTLTLSSLFHADYAVQLVASPSLYLCPQLHTLRFKNTGISAAQLMEIAGSRTKMVDQVGHFTEEVACLRILELEDCTNIKEKVQVDQALRALSLDVRWKYRG
ncbi:hypothetical protein BOTBODRAFT_36638 [Botryobasidium botryosum FD-172 SS1]|uniref:Uncharacterized protein n=1 Tax=Botryobasidium botryosum (strain FD-172 SS1) TaxID=930990 RepID=A0A067MDQ3_BOTB1|nr:hypothetical protein BOTBODRAFT_36638 [Botryobasidium botryosum FD-172 SS1]